MSKVKHILVSIALAAMIGAAPLYANILTLTTGTTAVESGGGEDPGGDNGGGDPGGGALTHGAEFTVTGTGFGTKPHTAPIIWDNMTTGTPASKYYDVRPTTAAVTAHQAGAYRDTPFTRESGTDAQAVPHPHARGTRIYAGCACSSANSFGYNVQLVKNFTKPTAPFVTLATFWDRMDVQMNESTNLKFFTWSVDVNEPGKYWYMDYQNGPLNLDYPSVETNDDSVPTFLSPPHEWGGSANSPRGQWVKRWIYLRHAAGSDAQLRYYENASDTPLLKDTKNVLDPYSGSTRTMMVGGFHGTTGQNNWRYMADVFMDAGEGWFFCTNNADWSSSTIRAIQPWKSWSDSNVTLEANLESLEGTCHLHFRMAPWTDTGHQYLGTRAIN